MDSKPPLASRRRLLHASALIGLAALAPGGHAAEPSLDGPGMPYDAFDRMPVETIDIGGRIVRVGFGPGDYALPRERILAYVRQSAQAVAIYFGRFPTPGVRVLIVNAGGAGRPVRSGTAFGYRGAAIRLLLSSDADADDLDRDWILVHEMSHLAMPSLPRQHHWLEEGMATYVEPLARAQAGRLSAERVWQDLRGGLPQGLPQAGDQGLDHTPTWGRTYWGGALFCLLADVETREATAGRYGLQHALRAIATHTNIEERSALEPLLEIGDAATGVPVLSDLHARMKDRPYPVDLGRLWAPLGVRESADGIAFDDSAPLAAIRRALTQRIA